MGFPSADRREIFGLSMSDPGTPTMPPEAALLAQRVSCHVVGVRPPEPAVSRKVGALAFAGAAGHGVEIACMTSFAARRSEVAALVRPVPGPRDGLDPLTGSLPARARAELLAAVVVCVATK